MIDKTNQLVLLFDFYGDLLTRRQREIFKLYYYEDLSLGEISDLEKISRQAVSDLLRRVEYLLSYYEDKLGLVDKFSYQQKRLNDLRKMLSRPKHEVSFDECLELLDELLRSEG